ncbi:MAG: hypothetical protein ACYDH6_22675 [Acidimicrobiales bacterium]
MLSVLGIAVGDELLWSWVRWLVPDVQPFFVSSLDAWRGVGGAAVEMSAELRDTYRLWNVDRTLDVLWLSEDGFCELPRPDRAALVRAQVANARGSVPTVRRWADMLGRKTLRMQGDGHRFVWWPRLVQPVAAQVLERVVSADRVASRHREVAPRTWQTGAVRVPGARALAGTFPSGSGPNCFGTVMAAAGVADAADQWMLREPFDAWLADSCSPGGFDGQAGTVLVWRNHDGVAVHAAITIGDGWALEKPSQEWSSPRAVVPVRDVIRTTRSPGHRLERHHLLAR